MVLPQDVMCMLIYVMYAMIMFCNIFTTCMSMSSQQAGAIWLSL
jgi:hypothetical protein